MATSQHSNDNFAAPSLLLLSAPSRPTTRAVLHAAYRSPVAAALSRLGQHGSGVAPILVIAVAGSVLAPDDRTDRPGFVRWKISQELLAELYTIIASLCSERAVHDEANRGKCDDVEARVVLVQYERCATKPEAHNRPYSHPRASSETVVLDLSTFAATVRPWKTIFHASSECGHELVAAYLARVQGQPKFLQDQIIAVDSGMAFSDSGSTPERYGIGTATTQDLASAAQDTEGIIRGHETVCLGGTFDHLHSGHKLLLEAAALLLRIPVDSGSCTMIIGVSGEKLLKNKEYAEEIQPWDARARCILTFLSTVFGAPTTSEVPVTTVRDEHGSPTSISELQAKFRDGAVLARCVKIQDPLGPTISEEAIDAIVASTETRGGAVVINSKRTARGWRPLKIYEVDLLDATQTEDVRHGNFGGREQQEPNIARPGSSESSTLAAKISSTEIRKRKAEARKFYLVSR
ncbi:hypothetical protein CDD83_5662 [Cordyceps sp. RAO-2017]|nr:hypothetical protein CDD83_5662 [Cordyceps sp. RAO-2017]